MNCDEGDYKDKSHNEILKGHDITKFENYTTLSHEEKVDWLTKSGQDIALSDTKLLFQDLKLLPLESFDIKIDYFI